MVRKCSRAIGSGLLFALLVAGLPDGAAAKVTMKLGHIFPEATPIHKAAVRIAELVAKATNGEIEVKVFPAGQLGGILDLFTALKAGTVELHYGGINTYAWIKGGEVFQITAVPFLYRDYAHMHGVLRSPVFKPHLEAAEKATGVKVIAINGDTAPRQLTTRDRPVRTAADFKGLKIRIAESAMVRAAMGRLGAIPQVIPFADLYLALKQGVVDAQENGVIVIKSASLYEVQKYLMLTNYIRDEMVLFTSMARWTALSVAHQQALIKAAEEAGEYETELTRRDIDEAVKFLATKMTVIEPDLASIRKALEGAYEEEFEGKYWPKGFLQQVRDFR